jgi:Spy/CpxP family protein refolding chaperone
MNRNKVALLLALGLSIGIAHSGIAFAADAPAKKPAMSDAEDGCRNDMMGSGHGHGMMGGMMDGGYGGGMMMESPRMNMVRSLDLSDDQRARINKLTDDLQHKNWERMGLIQDETAKLRDLYEADKRDPKAIGNEYRKIFDLKLQMIEAMVDTQNHVEELLTPEQAAKLKEMHRRMPMHGSPMH